MPRDKGKPSGSHVALTEIQQRTYEACLRTPHAIFCAQEIYEDAGELNASFTLIVLHALVRHRFLVHIDLSEWVYRPGVAFRSKHGFRLATPEELEERPPLRQECRLTRR